jgi:hypothetical protein
MRDYRELGFSNERLCVEETLGASRGANTLHLGSKEVRGVHVSYIMVAKEVRNY